MDPLLYAAKFDPFLSLDCVHPGAIQGMEEIKICHLATVFTESPEPVQQRGRHAAAGVHGAGQHWRHDAAAADATSPSHAGSITGRRGNDYIALQINNALLITLDFF